MTIESGTLAGETTSAARVVTSATLSSKIDLKDFMSNPNSVGPKGDAVPGASMAGHTTGEMMGFSDEVTTIPLKERNRCQGSERSGTCRGFEVGAKFANRPTERAWRRSLPIDASSGGSCRREERNRGFRRLCATGSRMARAAAASWTARARRDAVLLRSGGERSLQRQEKRSQQNQKCSRQFHRHDEVVGHWAGMP